MPRATSKAELLADIDREYSALEAALGALSPAQMIEPDIVGPWSVKDVVAHLVEWHDMVLGWHRAGLRGETPAIPAPGYKWNQLPALNQMIYEKHRDRPLDDVMTDFQRSHTETLGLIQSLSNEELVTPGHFAWTKKHSLGTYFVSNTSSHYLWARKEIRKGIKRKAKG